MADDEITDALAEIELETQGFAAAFRELQELRLLAEKHKPQQVGTGPRYHWNRDGSGSIEWFSLEELAKVNLSFALQMAQTAKDNSIERLFETHLPETPA